MAFLGLLLLIVGLVVTLGGLVLSILPVIADILCGRRAALRRAIRAAFVAAHVAVGIRVHGWLGAEYARGLAESRLSDGSCQGWGGDHSGCPPMDDRWLWVVFWASAGVVATLIVWGVQRWRARRAARPGDMAPGEPYNELADHRW